MRQYVWAIAAVCAWHASGRAAAFVRIDEFTADPAAQLGGGGGRYFTGSPADGFDCSVCHTSPEGYSFPLRQKGLPLDGYVPGKVYEEITLSWPDVTMAEQQALSRGLKPVTALMAEFVAEDGGNAGTLEFLNVAIRERRMDEYCAPVIGSPDRRYSATIIGTAKAKPPTILTPDIADADAEKRVCRTGGEDEQRCLLWVDPCGAKSITVKWSAPAQLRGPIWFSAGLVTTYDATSKPNDTDYATLLSVPMNAAPDVNTYEAVLESGCSVSDAPRTPPSQQTKGWLLMLSALVIVQRLRRRTRLASSSLLLGLLTLSASTSACTDTVYGTRASGSVGRFEPVTCGDACKMAGPSKCRSGTLDDWKMCTAKASAGASARPSGTAGSASLAGNALSATGAGAGPATPDKVNGKLQISFMTAQPPTAVSSHYPEDCRRDPACVAPNYVATWIEDQSGKYVKMLEHTGGFFQTSLPTYRNMGQDCLCEIDIISTPSVNVHQLHNIVWNGRDARGEPVPFGTYQLRIELAIDEMQSWRTAIPFTIAATQEPGTWPINVPPTVPHAGVTLNYTLNP